MSTKKEIKARRWRAATVLLPAASVVVGLAASSTGASTLAGNAPPTGAKNAAVANGGASAIAIEAAFVRVVKAVTPSVVEIATTSGLGSGVVYDSKGDIVTNAHVVGNAGQFTVSMSNGRQVVARLVGTYPPDDLAVIRLSSPVAGLRPASFGKSADLEVGDLVLAIGSPFGLAGSVTDGIVSFNGRTVSEGDGVVLPDLVQTSAAINPGNSGGALVSLSGQVVGIPTLGASNGSSSAAGVGFAISSDTVKLIAPQLINSGKVTKAGRAALGISGVDGVTFTGEAAGVIVTAVQTNGPAARGGISVGDVITAISGQATPDLTTLQSVLANLKPGAKAKVAVTGQAGQKRTVSVVLGDLALI
jgi:S1-C subfamily serine protease